MELEVDFYKMRDGEELGAICSCQVDDNYIYTFSRGEFFEEVSEISDFMFNGNIKNIKYEVEKIIDHHNNYNSTTSALDNFFHKLVAEDLFRKLNDNIKIEIGWFV